MDDRMKESLDRWLTTPPEVEDGPPTAEDLLSDIHQVNEGIESLLERIANTLDSIDERLGILAAVAKGNQCNYCGNPLDDGNSHLHGGHLNP